MTGTSRNSSAAIPAILILLILTASLTAQSSDSEAGTYYRPSVTFLDDLILLDRSVNSLSPDLRQTISKGVSKVVTLKRFDHNVIPQKLDDESYRRNNSLSRSLEYSDEIIDSFTTSLENSRVLKAIARQVYENREARAINLMTDQQKNSFAADKAKEAGYTQNELIGVAHSVFLFSATAANYKENVIYEKEYFYDTSYTINSNGERVIASVRRASSVIHQHNISLEIGLMAWQVTRGADKKLRLTPYGPITYAGEKQLPVEDSYSIEGNRTTALKYGLWHMAHEAGERFTDGITVFEPFRLTTQILSQRGSSVTFDLEDEKLRVDTKFLLLRSEENDSGELEMKRRGWLMVKRPKKGSSTFRGKVIAGDPYVGMVIQEKPMGRGELALHWKTYSLDISGGTPSTKRLASAEIENTSGPSFEFAGNLFRRVGASQLFIVGSAGLSFGKAKGTFLSLDGDTLGLLQSSVGGHYDISIRKRFYVRRFGFMIQGGGGFEHRKYEANTLDLILRHSGFGGFAAGGIDFALTPGLSLSTALGYRLFQDSKLTYEEPETTIHGVARDKERLSTSVTSSGLSLSFGFTFQPVIRLK